MPAFFVSRFLGQTFAVVQITPSTLFLTRDFDMTYRISRLALNVIPLILVILIQSECLSEMLCMRSDSSSVQQLRPGVIHRFIRDQRGPWNIHILEIDLTQPDLAIGAGRAQDSYFGREQTTSIARRHSSPDRKVIAAINSDFFDLKSGEVENDNIIDGEFIKGTKMTGSPFDTFDNIHSQFALSVGKKPFIDRFALEGTVIWGGSIRSDLQGVNDIPKSGGLVLFNSYYGRSTPTDTLKMTILERPLSLVTVRSDTLLVIVSGEVSRGGSSLSKGSFVLSGYDLTRSNPLSTLRRGDTLKIWLGLRPNRGPLQTLVGGWPRIVLDGTNIAAGADYAEGTFPRFSSGRHPRSGVGFSKDSTKVYFIVVDGRTQQSVGMSLIEFGDLMVASGAYQAMNFDGGGSTTLVLNGRIVNVPSDATGERAVGNCLLLYELKGK
jgi:hypothetical protein